MTDDVLTQLVGTSPRRLLEDLARMAVVLAKNDRPRPEVELFLASGQVVRGRIVNVADDRHGAVAVVHVGGQARAPGVTFVRVDQVTAINVADASVLVRAPVSDAPAPSRLELQRQLASRLDGLQGKLGRTPLKIELVGDLDDDNRRAIGVLVPVLFDVLNSIVDDEMGKQAISALASIELGAASEASVTKQQRGFLIRAPKLLSEQFTHATLRRELEKQL